MGNFRVPVFALTRKPELFAVRQARLQRLQQLDENLFDLSVELNDLADEIAGRCERVRAVRQLLRDTQLEIAVLSAVDDGVDA
jgi:hypothetical protein